MTGHVAMMSEQDVRGLRSRQEESARRCSDRGWHELWSQWIASIDVLSEVLGEPQDAAYRIPYRPESLCDRISDIRGSCAVTLDLSVIGRIQ